MKSVLSELYAGALSPATDYFPQLEKYKQLYKAHYQHYSEFIERLKALDPALHKQYVDIVDEQTETLPLEIEEMFVDGFCLGARMMIEVYQKEVAGPRKWLPLREQEP